MSARERLEYLRGELRAERISYGELAELQGLADQIDPSDVELLEAAGVPEHPEDDRVTFHPYVTIVVRDGKVVGVAVDWMDTLLGVEDDIEHPACAVACAHLDGPELRQRVVAALMPAEVQL